MRLQNISKKIKGINITKNTKKKQKGGNAKTQRNTRGKKPKNTKNPSDTDLKGLLDIEFSKSFSITDDTLGISGEPIVEKLKKLFFKRVDEKNKEKKEKKSKVSIKVQKSSGSGLFNSIKKGIGEGRGTYASFQSAITGVTSRIKSATGQDIPRDIKGIRQQLGALDNIDKKIAKEKEKKALRERGQRGTYNGLTESASIGGLRSQTAAVEEGESPCICLQLPIDSEPYELFGCIYEKVKSLKEDPQTEGTRSGAECENKNHNLKDTKLMMYFKVLDNNLEPLLKNYLKNINLITLISFYRNLYKFKETPEKNKSKKKKKKSKKKKKISAITMW